MLPVSGEEACLVKDSMDERDEQVKDSMDE